MSTRSEETGVSTEYGSLGIRTDAVVRTEDPNHGSYTGIELKHHLPYNKYWSIS